MKDTSASGGKNGEEVLPSFSMLTEWLLGLYK
jgi:hypothetical protein